MEIGMVKQPLFYLMLGTVMLGLASSPVLAQSSGSGGSGGSDSESSGSSESNPTDSNTPSSTGEASESGSGSSEHNCPPSQMWNAQSMACETK
jgi:hypothetical protein